MAEGRDRGEAAHRGRILVVDDDPCLRELLARHLSRAGYEVAVAEDAIAAGRYILDFGVPRLMVVDVNMPYMDGLEFVAALQADRDIELFPVIFLTVDPGAEPRARALGAAAFLVKPVATDRLLFEVARHISPRGAALPISAGFGAIPEP
jgi:two-component system chemotaxis response regulator CheY